MSVEKKKWSNTRIFITFFGLFWLVSVSIGLWFLWSAYTFMSTAPEVPGQDVVVDIAPGSSFDSVSRLLAEKKLITDVFSFKILARYQDMDSKLQAGRFQLNTAWLPNQVLEHLVDGKPLLYRITIREGLPWWEVAQLLEAEGFCKAQDFAKIIHDPAFLRHWGIPFASAEGFLYPDTYLVPQPQNLDEQAARAIAGRLVDTFWRNANQLWPQGRPDKDTLKSTLTMASIIEKETGVPAERPIVSGVYHNRLTKKMLLQADPTVIYGLGQNFSGPLLKKHLEDDKNDYNTYRKAGLPPGPICSPGLASLRAALNPEAHSYLYLVATGLDKGHVFSKNLGDHNRAVQEYRRNIRQNAQ